MATTLILLPALLGYGGAVDYLLKPFDAERFGQAFARARRRVETAPAGASLETLERLLRDAEGRRPLRRLVQGPPAVQLGQRALRSYFTSQVSPAASSAARSPWPFFSTTEAICSALSSS